MLDSQYLDTRIGAQIDAHMRKQYKKQITKRNKEMLTLMRINSFTITLQAGVQLQQGCRIS